jgi:hypothetical protein
VTEQAISPLRRRMIEDMTIRKFAQKTQHDYVQRVKEFASYLKRSPTGRCTRLSVASDVERRRHAEDQRHRCGTAVLFQGDAWSFRPRQAPVDDT